jgi:hypothetical protein
VGYLRRKLEPLTDVDPIETVRGFGYRYSAPAASPLRIVRGAGQDTRVPLARAS